MGRSRTMTLIVFCGLIFLPAAAWAQADFNGDDIVDSLDFGVLASHFGFKAPLGDVALGVAVPEPANVFLTTRGDANTPPSVPDHLTSPVLASNAVSGP